MKGKKITHRIKKWKLGDYFRQFSIVVAGIIVTFFGSDLVAEHARQKEVESVMQFVRSELEHNKEELQRIQNTISKERQISLYLTGCNFNIREIPADTLQKYIQILATGTSFGYTSNALEVLKNSSLMQQIRNKRLLLDLVKSYDTLQQVKELATSFYKIKDDLLIKLSLSFSNEDRKAHLKGDVYTIYEAAMKKSTGMQNFCWITNGYFNPDFLPNAIQLLDNSIKAIAREYPSE